MLNDPGLNLFILFFALVEQNWYFTLFKHTEVSLSNLSMFGNFEWRTKWMIDFFK